MIFRYNLLCTTNKDLSATNKSTIYFNKTKSKRSIFNDQVNGSRLFLFIFQFKCNVQNRKLCKKAITEIIKDKVCIDRKILESQLNQSAIENLEYLNYQILKVIFPGLKQLEKLKKNTFIFF